MRRLVRERGGGGVVGADVNYTTWHRWILALTHIIVFCGNLHLMVSQMLP